MYLLCYRIQNTRLAIHDISGQPTNVKGKQFNSIYVFTSGNPGAKIDFDSEIFAEDAQQFKLEDLTDQVLLTRA